MVSQQVLVSTLNGRTVALNFSTDCTSICELKQRLYEVEGIPCSLQRLYSNGRLCINNLSGELIFIHLSLSLPGGKGGFGSLLRGSGAGTKKTSNFSANRDLSGRRMRHVDNERELAEFEERQRGSVPQDTRTVQEEFKSIKTGKRTQTRMCKFGHECKYRHSTCHYRHPNTSNEQPQSSKRQRNNNNDDEVFTALDMALGTSTSDRIASAIADGFRAVKAAKKNEKNDTVSLSPSTTTVASLKQSTSSSSSLPSSSSSLSSSSLPSSSSSSSSSSSKCISKASVLTEVKPMQSNTSPKASSKINLASVSSASELESLGMDCLKEALMQRRLKAGGTLSQRAQRLFMLKSTPIHMIAAKHRAKAVKLCAID